MTRFPPGRRRSLSRRGVVTIEVLGVVPLLIIFAISIAEFSMAMRLNHKVSFSSRYGAKLASELPRSGNISLGNYNLPDTPDNLKLRIDAWLTASGLTPSAAVLLEHNACGAANPRQLQTADGIAIDDAELLPALPEASPAQNACYVRVTVWLPVLGNVPNALKTFGLDWTGALLRHSTVFRLESDNTPPVAVIDVPAASLPAGYRLLSSGPSSPSADGPAPIRLSTTRAGKTTLTFSGRGSRDAESSRGTLQYRWNGTARAAGVNDRPEYRTQIDMPPGTQIQRFQVSLAVTDECGCSSQFEVPVEVTRGDLVPVPDTSRN